MKRNNLHGLSLSCGHTQHTSQYFLIICDARVGPTASTGTASLIFKQTLYPPPTVHPAHRWARSTVLPCGRTHFPLARSQGFISNASSLRRRRKRSCPPARQPCPFAAPAKPRYRMARSVYRKHELDAKHCTSADAAMLKSGGSVPLSGGATLIPPLHAVRLPPPLAIPTEALPAAARQDQAHLGEARRCGQEAQHGGSHRRLQVHDIRGAQSRFRRAGCSHLDILRPFLVCFSAMYHPSRAV